jgi:hypothetical protein
LEILFQGSEFLYPWRDKERSNEMKKKLMFLVMLIVIGFCFAPLSALAITVNYMIGADDYASLDINGSRVATFDQGGAGTAVGTVTLEDGWYDITIDYKNRWGTDWLGLYWDPGTVAPQGVLPEAYLRSQDAAGQWISGLRADYYYLDGTFIQTIYGEGPIAHGYNSYEGYGNGRVWPIVGYSGLFEEVLTGQIYVGADPVPEPATMLLLSSGLVGLAGIRGKFRKK